MSDYVDKLRSLNVARPERRGPKVTVERDGHLSAKTVEHWDDRVDVTIRPPAVRMKRSDICG